MAHFGEGLLQNGVDSGGGVLLDTGVVSMGVTKLGGVESSSLEKECGGILVVMTDGNEGVVAVGYREGRVGSERDVNEGTVSASGSEGSASCLFSRDLQDHRANSKELLPVLTGRLDGTPQSTPTLDGRVMIIVPERSPSCKDGEREQWLIKKPALSERGTSMYERDQGVCHLGK